MNSINNEHSSSSSSDIDICNTSPNSSPQKMVNIATSTPHQTYKPRVNFHSIESLVSSSLNTSSSVTPLSSPFSFQRHDDTGYSSFNSSILTSDKENIDHSIRETNNERKPRRKLSDWQIWHLRQTFASNRYPTPYEQEQLAQQLLLPLSSVRIWFQNYRARSGKK